MNKQLIELIQKLSPEQQEQVLDYVQYLLIQPAGLEKKPDVGGPGPDAVVSLREITEDTLWPILKLSDTLTPPKKNMVAPNAVSIAEAHFSPKAWFRAIYADDTPVGFLMLYDDPEKPEYFLWRLMVAEPHHGKGFGRRGLELLIDYVKTRPGAQILRTSCGQGAGNPEGFYRRLGFQRDGKMYDDEVGLGLPL